MLRASSSLYTRLRTAFNVASSTSTSTSTASTANTSSALGTTTPQTAAVHASLTARHHIRPFSTSLTYHVKKRMPPKKQQVVEKPKLGRPSNNLKMGIVGLPNVGKSSLFNVIAKCDLGKSANFP